MATTRTSTLLQDRSEEIALLRTALQKIASYDYTMGPAIDRINYLRGIAKSALANGNEP